MPSLAQQGARIVVNDIGERNVSNRIFRNDGSDGGDGWIFTDHGHQAVLDYPMFGMGIAPGDYRARFRAPRGRRVRSAATRRATATSSR